MYQPTLTGVGMHSQYLFILQVIQKDYRIIGECFTAMLRECLMMSPNPTWFDLVEALRARTVDRPDIAAVIEDKYIKSDVSSVQKKEDTAS